VSLPVGWARVRLGDVVEIHDHRRIPLNQAQRAARPGPYPYYGANGRVGTVDDFLFEGDYILLAEDGGYFDDPFRPNAYAVSGRFWVNNHAHILRASEAIDHWYLLHVLNATDLMPYVSGTTRLKLTQADMRRIPIPLPPLAEQRRIVARIEALFARTRRARAELQRIAPLAEQYRGAVLDAAYTGSLTGEWRERRGRPEPPLVRLDHVVSELRYGTAQKCTSEPHGVPVLRIPNIVRGQIDLSDLKYASLDARDLNRLRLSEGDILIIRSNGSPDLVGRAAVVTRAASGMAFAGYLIRARPKVDVILPGYLAIMLESPQIRRHIELNARSSSGVHNINSAELGALQLLLPALDEQAEALAHIETGLAGMARLTSEAARGRPLRNAG